MEDSSQASPRSLTSNVSPGKFPLFPHKVFSPTQKAHQKRFFQHRLTKLETMFIDHLPIIPKSSHFRRESENLALSRLKNKQTPDIKNTSFSDELKIALKHISVSPTKERKHEKKLTYPKIQIRFRSIEDTEISNFIQAMFTNEPTPFRKSELTVEPESIDIRAAEKLLQEANKIVKNGIKKKQVSQEIGGAIEEFWKSNISRNEFVRWDLFEESFICFLETYMVCDMATLRKVNWKKLLQKIYGNLGKKSDNFSLWPKSITIENPIVYEEKLVWLTDWINYIQAGELLEAIKSSLEDTPTYISNIRKGETYKFACGSIYKGEWREGKREGSGNFMFASGESYQGNFVRGLREDYGTFKGHRYLYKGEFKKDRFHGYGKIKFPDDSTFEGLWNKGKMKNGTYNWNSGWVYKGEMLNNKFDGTGKLIFPDGSKHKGTWKSGKLCGEGKITNNEGLVIKGVFNEGQIQGEGMLECRDYKYNGEIKNLLPHGTGIIEWINGNEYSGKFFEGKMHGEGCLKENTGDTYTGTFNMNIKHERGKIKFADGGVYEGEISNGEFHGKGVLYYPEGHEYKKYEGLFEDGVFHKEGILEYSNGSIYRGEWEMGEKNGKGIFKTSEFIYEGGFYEGKFNGFGEYRNGKAFCLGTWINGVPDGRAEVKDWDGNLYVGIFNRGEPANRHKLESAFLKTICSNSK
ncbi:unnamed protein product [Blepharisma stoltei]|uniref:Uncharacterized protein n=1 Tax=Blepharisma stoltei TaxID=1481888 RepID=A0AAU9JM08_9CILI|nr:unnamed protein product [Blepharisma stoltei]